MWFAPLTFIFFQNMSEGHVTTYRYFFAKERKKPLNYQIEQRLQLLKSHSSLEFLSLEFLNSPGNNNFFREFVRW